MMEKISNDIEAIWLKIKTRGSQSLEVMNLYPPPGTDTDADTCLVENIKEIGSRPDVELDCNFAMFADDVKVWKVIHNAADVDDFQEILRRLNELSRKWLMSFNSNKFTLLRPRNQNQVTDMRLYYLNDLPLHEAHTPKDL
ncbi:unnamed protein product [Schistocephalus solidus]|uniref:Reverse transcriptase domain-containing protein n=1 Tax=Schistocephalus solidus TaxID=70667 RepID=A0A183TQM6_SCHSO|nr:unnamed protein product [Schistocephalus solidus]